jgi:hypothetical protein
MTILATFIGICCGIVFCCVPLSVLLVPLLPLRSSLPKSEAVAANDNSKMSRCQPSDSAPAIVLFPSLSNHRRLRLRAMASRNVSKSRFADAGSAMVCEAAK